jgi:hypothetical protein
MIKFKKTTFAFENILKDNFKICRLGEVLHGNKFSTHNADGIAF